MAYRPEVLTFVDACWTSVLTAVCQHDEPLPYQETVTSSLLVTTSAECSLSIAVASDTNDRLTDRVQHHLKLS